MTLQKTKKNTEEYSTEITLVAAIDEFITKKKNMSQSEKWEAFNIVAEKYGFDTYEGVFLDRHPLIAKINKQIRKRGLSVWNVN